MIDLLISVHAVDRYRERVADLPEAQCRAAMNCRAAQAAAEFGAPFVRLPSGHRLVIRNATVITVLPSDVKMRALSPDRNPANV